jgi:hypothetical protein
MASNKTRTQNFNKLAANAVKGYEFKNGKESSKSKYKTEAEYQKSFDDILKFEKSFTDAQKSAINLVIYHDENNDGIISAYIAWKYLVNESKKDVKFIGLKPGRGRDIDDRIKRIDREIDGKNVLILDLNYSNKTFDFIKNISKQMIVVDDHHGGEKYNDVNAFVGQNHAAVAYAWKFFYPKEAVPKIVQYVDDSDAKLFLPYIPFSNLVTSSIGFRFVHDIFRPKGSEAFEKLHELFKNDNVNFFIFLGKYYEEVKENLKYQIANNAVIRDFQGYKVGALDFNAPSLVKPVGRQIISNMNKDGHVIDFVVLFGYEFTANPGAYRVQLIDDHKQTNISMKDIAERLGRAGGHSKGGGGHQHVGNFYWTGDIFDLFKKKYI